MLELNEKTENLVGTATAIGTGFLAWEYTATRKYNPNYAARGQGSGLQSLFNNSQGQTLPRLTDAIAGLIGNGNAKALNPSWTGGADFKPNVMGWANKTTLIGAALLIADKILVNFKEYKQIPALQIIVKNAGLGITVGGVVGGIFDPDPKTLGNYQANPQNRHQNQTVNISM